MPQLPSRKYEMQAISSPQISMTEDEFKNFILKSIESVHLNHEYLVCIVHIGETSRQLNPSPPPYNFIFKFTVSKKINDKSKNFESPKLLFDRLRTDPYTDDISLSTLIRTYGEN